MFGGCGIARVVSRLRREPYVTRRCRSKALGCANLSKRRKAKGGREGGARWPTFLNDTAVRFASHSSSEMTFCCPASSMVALGEQLSRQSPASTSLRLTSAAYLRRSEPDGDGGGGGGGGGRWWRWWVGG